MLIQMQLIDVERICGDALNGLPPNALPSDNRKELSKLADCCTVSRLLGRTAMWLNQYEAGALAEGFVATSVASKNGSEDADVPVDLEFFSTLGDK